MFRARFAKYFAYIRVFVLQYSKFDVSGYGAPWHQAVVVTVSLRGPGRLPNRLVLLELDREQDEVPMAPAVLGSLASSTVLAGSWRSVMASRRHEALDAQFSDSSHRNRSQGVGARVFVLPRVTLLG